MTSIPEALAQELHTLNDLELGAVFAGLGVDPLKWSKGQLEAALAKHDVSATAFAARWLSQYTGSYPQLACLGTGARVALAAEARRCMTLKSRESQLLELIDAYREAYEVCAKAVEATEAAFVQTSEIVERPIDRFFSASRPCPWDSAIEAQKRAQITLDTAQDELLAAARKR